MYIVFCSDQTMPGCRLGPGRRLPPGGPEGGAAAARLRLPGGLHHCTALHASPSKSNIFSFSRQKNYIHNVCHSSYCSFTGWSWTNRTDESWSALVGWLVCGVGGLLPRAGPRPLTDCQTAGTAKHTGRLVVASLGVQPDLLRRSRLCCSPVLAQRTWFICQLISSVRRLDQVKLYKVAEDLFARSSLVDFINDPFPSAGWSNREGEGRNHGTKADQLASGT